MGYVKRHIEFAEVADNLTEDEDGDDRSAKKKQVDALFLKFFFPVS